MVMPLPTHMRLPSPTNRPASASHPRSPVKKHLRDAGFIPLDHRPTATPVATTKTKTTTTRTPKLGSPQKLKATVASQSVESTVAQFGSADTMSSDSHATNASGGRLRAATLQAVLGLVDRDDAALLQLLPLLLSLAALPLEKESVRRQCGAALQQLHAAAKRSPAVAMVSTPPSPPRDSGRAKSAVSLRHCRAFLLACANEIHELEEMDPSFDYAEETSSEPLAPPAKLFDYASTVDSGSSVPTAYNDDGSDDADTGSQLSELLLRTVEAEQADATASTAICRRVFRSWRSLASAAPLRTAFAVLKKHRAASALSRQRKQRVFQRMKQLVARPSAVAVPWSPAVRFFLTLLVLHWDLVLLLAIACVVELVRRP